MQRYIGIAALLIAQAQRNDMKLMTTAETDFDDRQSIHFLHKHGAFYDHRQT
jgi:hypothetical protein